MKFVDLGTRALRTAGAVGQGVPVSASDLSVAFDLCQEMFDSWAAQRLTVFQTLMKVVTVIANKGTTADPYTIGIGGDIDCQRPTWISAANLRVNTTNPFFRIALAVLTYNQDAAVTIPNLSSALAQALYYNGKFDTSGVDVGLGEIYLYPVPNGQQPTDLELWLPTPMTGFADMATTDYTFPPGYAEALRYQLAKRISIEFDSEMSAANQAMATESFAVIQRDNVEIPVMLSDYGIPGTNRYTGLFNWRTGCGGGRP